MRIGGVQMIKSEERNGKRETVIDGTGHDALIDLIYVLDAFVHSFRKVGIPDNAIEEQLVNCIAGGFKVADETNKGGEVNE